MKIQCVIDGEEKVLSESPDKPLHKILSEQVPSFSVNNNCLGSSCGNCLVIVNGAYTLACLTPAFKLDGANIQTYESFSKTRLARDIFRAYTEVGSHPCSQCYASKTLLIASIVLMVEKADELAGILQAGRNLYQRKSVLDENFVKQEMRIHKCVCMEISHIEKIVALVCEYRQRSNGIYK